MKRNSLFTVLMCIMLIALMTACKDKTDYENLRELSWKGTELTISLGTNKSTGCEWETKSQDDSIIDYSINRKFHLSDGGTLKGEAYGRLDAGFEGKSAGTTEIICTTPVGWDGKEPGYTYTVTVTVNEDGTIDSATGE